MVSSRQFPADAQGEFLITNVIGFRGVMRHRLRDAGAGFAGEKVGAIAGVGRSEFSARGAAVRARWGAVRGRLVQPAHRAHAVPLRDPRRDHVHGRVWRIVAQGRALLDDPVIAGRPLAELLELLRTPEDRVRYRVRRELGERGPEAVAAAVDVWVAGLARSDPAFDALRLEALWVRQTVGRVDAELLASVLQAEDPRARAAALRVARAWRHALADPLDVFANAVLDEHPRVRLEAVTALSYLGFGAGGGCGARCAELTGRRARRLRPGGDDSRARAALEAGPADRRELRGRPAGDAVPVGASRAR